MLKNIFTNLNNMGNFHARFVLYKYEVLVKGEIMTSVQGVKYNLYPVNFRADNRQSRQSDPPMLIRQQQQMPQRKKEKNNQKLMQSLSLGVGILASLTLVALFLPQAIEQFRSSAKRRKAEKALEKAFENALKDPQANPNSALDTILENCKDKTIVRAVKEEMEKGPMSMSQKKINALLELAKVNETKLKVVDIEKAKKILDDKVIGMENVKKQVIEFLEYRNACIKAGIKPDKPLVIALDGPPGTAKTTLCKAVAEACELPSKEISMAGATGKAKIIGNESVYQGASWGEFADGQIEHKTKDMVYILDELEKTGTSEHNGKPDDALLSFLDGRHKGYDDFLGVDVDISNSIVMITTNDYNKLSEPIRDRISYVYHIKPYTLEEKAAVARFKMGKALEYHKIKDMVNLPQNIYDTIAKEAKGEGGRDVTNISENITHKIFCLPREKGKKVDVTSDMISRWIDEAHKAA